MPTVIDEIRRNANQFASNPAIIEGERVWTHAKLWDRVDRLSQNFLFRLFRGDVVLAWLSNVHEAIEAELACLQSWCVWVSANSRFTAQEFIGIYDDCFKRGLLIIDAEHLSRLWNLILPSELGERTLLTGSDVELAGFGSYEAVIRANESIRPPGERGHAREYARLRYTSGTTGKPKAAILPHRVYLASLHNLQHELHPLGPDDRVLHAAPLTHASGALVFPILAAGGANVILPHFDVEKVLETIETQRITTMFIVPTILHWLASSPSFQTRDLSSLKTIFYGGAPTSIEQLNPIIERLGTKLVHIYGMTEAPYPITTLKREEHWVGNPKLGSIGKPTTICRLKITDETGNELGEDEVGEIWVRGANVMSGYWHDDEETKKVLKGKWLATGDLGKRDTDGYYWIVDRKKDVIISGGFNVYAKEVESVLCAHSEIAEAAVVGIPHSDWGEMVAAFVVLKPGSTLDSETIAQWCHQRLSGYKCPKRVEIIGELPKNSSGKILKKALTDAGQAPTDRS